MKYIYNELNDFVKKCGKTIFVREQEIPIGEDKEGNKEIIVVLVCGSKGADNELHFHSDPVFADKGMSREEYIRKIQGQFVTLCEKIKDKKATVEIIKGGIEE
jgi:hypothetical protein